MTMLEHFETSDDYASGQYAQRVYDLPKISGWLRRHKCCRYVPFLPAFDYQEPPVVIVNETEVTKL